MSYFSLRKMLGQRRPRVRSRRDCRLAWGLRAAFYTLVLAGGLLGLNEHAFALRANEVAFEFHPGFYRVNVRYTLPALKEFREATAEFKSKKKATEFYWRLVRGAEFYIGDPARIEFVADRTKPEPW